MQNSSSIRLLALAALFFLGLSGCDLLGEEEEQAPVTTGVYVANQGNFSDGNGSVSVYEPRTGQVNAGAVDDLGSIVQSLHLAGDRLYVVANTGDRIDVFDASSFERVGQIGGFVSPRYLVEGPGTRAYVTNLYGAPGSFTGGKVSVVDLAGQKKVKDIDVGDNPEGLTYVGDRLYVANHGFGAGRSLTVIDTKTDTVTGSVDVDCDGPRFLAADGDDEVWVFCTGTTLYDDNWQEIGRTNGAVRVLDGATGAIVDRIDLEGPVGTPGPGQDAFHAPEARVIYAVVNGRTLARFDTRTNTRAGTVGPLEGAPIGAVAYDARAERLYVGRVPGFSERGTVTIHDRTGAQVGSFAAGVAPAFITLARED